MFDADQYISEYQQLEHGAPRLRALKKAIQAADEAKNTEWSFRFRERFLHDSTFENDCVDALIMFPEMLALYDESEELQADDEFQHMLMWDFKWILGNATDFHHIPLEQIEGFFEEFKKRLEAYGKSLRPYYYLYEMLSVDTGRLLPREEYGKYRDYPEDDLNDCKACVANHDVRIALALGDEEAALRFAKPIFNDELHCAEIPQKTYEWWILHDIRKGAYAHAHTLAKRLYPMAKHEMQLLDCCGVLLHLYSVIDRSTGTTILRRELRNYLQCRNHFLKFMFAAGAYRLFDKMQMDTITLVLPQDFPLYSSTHRYQSAALRDYFLADAKALAEKFDARNGNSTYMDMLLAEDPPYDEAAPECVTGNAEQQPSVIGAVCSMLPDTLTTESVSETIERDGRFRVILSHATEEGLLAFQIADGKDSDEIFQLMLVCQPVPPVREFRPASPIAEGVAEAVENAEGVVLCIMPFEEKAPDLALHFQLKLLQLICPGAVAYLDYSRMKLLPAGWVTLAAMSDVPPLVDYLYNLNLTGDDDSEYLRIVTQGLRCCGLREIEILDATKQNFPRYCDLLCFAAERMLLRGEMPDARTPFTVLHKRDNTALICTWLPASEAMGDYPENDAAGMRLHIAAYADDEEARAAADGNAVLYLYDGEEPDGSPRRKRLNTLTNEEFEMFCYGSYIATSRKIAELAKERIDIFRSLLERAPENAYVCVYVANDDEEDEVWLKALEAEDGTVRGILTADCLAGKAGSEYTAQLSQLTDFSVRLDENLVVHPNTAYIGLEIE